MPYVIRAGVRLYYEDSGIGPTVLLHTGGGGDGRMWDLAGYTSALSGYRTLVLDHRGHGHSDCPPGLAAHQLGEYVADVIAVLDDAGVDQAALIGYSAGAQVAYAAARFHPDRIGAVVGLGAVGAADDEDDSAEAGAEIRANGMRATMEAMAAGEPQAPPSWLIDNLAETDAEMFALLIEAWCKPPGSWPDFPYVKAPTLIVCGSDEEPDAALHVELAARTLPAGSAVILPGLSHLQAFWRIDESIPPVLAFLRSHWE
jgi:pimeloyl-ACP methyl ester carboxylesterase